MDLSKNMTPEIKAQIDNMGREDMACFHRFAPAGSVYFAGEAGRYFDKRFKELGGFSPEISKRIGWD